MFGLPMVESRAVLRIGTSGPLSLDELADHIAISKSQTSRVVSALVHRNLVKRDRDPDHARGIAITLSREGRIVERALKEAAVVRNQELTAGLDPAVLARTSDLLDELIRRARLLLQSDQARNGESAATDESGDDSADS
jgi:DNA-binding MarR family transcriptional regulator